MRNTGFIIILFISVIISGCTDFKNKKAIKEMVRRHPELYSNERAVSNFKKGISIYDPLDSVTVQLYLSHHHEQQYVVLSKPGRNSYAIPFPEFHHDYLHYEGVKHKKNTKTLADELQAAVETLCPDMPANGSHIYRHIFIGLFGARHLISSDSIHLKALIQPVKNLPTKKLFLNNYKSIFNRYNKATYRPDVYVCAFRGEIYEVIFNPNTKGFPYKINIYWRPAF